MNQSQEEATQERQTASRVMHQCALCGMGEDQTWRSTLGSMACSSSKTAQPGSTRGSVNSLCPQPHRLSCILSSNEQKCICAVLLAGMAVMGRIVKEQERNLYSAVQRRYFLRSFHCSWLSGWAPLILHSKNKQNFQVINRETDGIKK